MAGLFIIVWFATSGPRASRAAQFDTASQSALEHNNIAEAYRDSRFAYALHPSPERLLNVGSLAYLNRDYDKAEQAFSAVPRQTTSRTYAEVGVAAAAAGRNEKKYRTARDTIRYSNNLTIKGGVAYAAVRGGYLGDAADLLSNTKLETFHASFPRIAGLAADDPAAAAQALAASKPGVIRLQAPSKPYERFLKALTEVPDTASRQLDATLGNMSLASSPATKKIVLAQTLYRLGYYRASMALADTAVRTETAYRDGWNTLAAAQIALGQTNAAERSLKTSLDLDGSFGYTWYLKSELAKAQGNTKQALQYKDRAEQLGY